MAGEKSPAAKYRKVVIKMGIINSGAQDVIELDENVDMQEYAVYLDALHNYGYSQYGSEILETAIIRHTINFQPI